MIPALRELLVCPVCRGDLEDAPDALICRRDRLVFPIVDGIPHIARDFARKLQADGE